MVLMARVSPQTPKTPLTSVIFCHGCGADRRVEFISEQRWPAKVALAAGLKPHVELWRCTQCLTTIMVEKS